MSTLHNITCPKCRAIHSVDKDQFMGFTNITCNLCNTTFDNPLKVDKQKQRKIIGAVIVGFLIIAIIANTCESESSNTTNTYVITQDSHATTSKEAFDATGRYSVDGDNSAIQSLINNGEVVGIHRGEEVFLVESGFGYMIVRRKGSTQQLWILTEDARKQ